VVWGVKVLCQSFDRNETTGIPPSSDGADTSPRGQNLWAGLRIKFSPTGGGNHEVVRGVNYVNFVLDLIY